MGIKWLDIGVDGANSEECFFYQNTLHWRLSTTTGFLIFHTLIFSISNQYEKILDIYIYIYYFTTFFKSIMQNNIYKPPVAEVSRLAEVDATSVSSIKEITDPDTLSRMEGTIIDGYMRGYNQKVSAAIATSAFTLGIYGGIMSTPFIPFESVQSFIYEYIVWIVGGSMIGISGGIGLTLYCWKKESNFYKKYRTKMIAILDRKEDLFWELEFPDATSSTIHDNSVPRE